MCIFPIIVRRSMSFYPNFLKLVSICCVYKVRLFFKLMTSRNLFSRSLIQQVRQELRVIGTEDTSVNFYSGSKLGWEVDEDVGIIELQNTRARNAINGRMMYDLSVLIDELEENKRLKCIILRGHNGHFCAGADLQMAQEYLGTTKGGEQMSSVMIDSLTRFRHLPFITIAAIEGGAVGGGAELATACDYRIIHANAFLRFVHTKMGITPGWGGGTRLVRLIGRQNALKLLSAATVCNANDALEYSLVDCISPSDRNLWDTVYEFMRPFLQAEAHVLQETKRVVAHADDLVFESALRTEQSAFLSLWGGPANKRALAAQVRK